MAQFTSFSEKTPHSRNEVFVNTSRDKQEGYNKRVLPDSKLKTESTNNNSNRTINEPYETQDSAYSTSDSSYNTVDSSYSQRSNSSGYSTLEIKWKQPQSKHDFEKRRNDLHKIDGERMPGQFGSDSALAFQLSDPNSKQIKFVDDIDDSDTATETETDTELTLSSSAIEPDMSYVPDYIRTVSAPISFVAPAITTASFTVSRPIIASTMTSSVVSVSTSTKPSTASVKDETCAMSPIKSSSNDRRRADKNMSYTGYRENYERKQKEKVCGRKSLDERLKSLESGAAVKLQVCKGSQNRRQKTEKEDITSTSRPLSSTAKAYSRPRTRSSDHDHNQSNIEQDLQVEPTPTRAPPPPDIIESHQPRVSTQASPSRGSDDRPTPTNDDQRNFPKYAKPSSFSDPLSKSTSERTKSEARNVHVAIKWKTATPPTPRRQLSDVPMKGQDLQSGTEDLKVSAQSFESKYAAEISDVVNSETPQSPSRIETTSSKLSWKRPSQEALNRLNESAERTKSPALNTVSSSMVEPHTTPTTSNSLFEVEKPFERGEGLLQRRGAPVSLVVDVPADNNPVANVELRSLPTEADGSDRSYLRGKRNARMFALPSSDDNENDNFVSKGYRHVENRTVRVAPVKFVPSVLRRSRSRSARGEDSQSSSTSSLVADVKIITSEHPKSYPSNPSEEQSLRKSSRTPKRSNSKKNRSKSTHDRPSTEAKTYSHSRTLSSGSHSPVPVSSGGSSDRYKQSSPETPVRSRNHRSGGKSSRNSSKNRYKTEYAELTNVKRTTPRSNRKLLEVSSLPSPRQLAVAHAVKFGFTGNEGTIPYIDETNSPEEQKKQIIENPSKDLSSDVRPHDADNATLKRAFPLGRRGRSMKKKEVSRTTSYMEAVGSSDDVTHASEADKSRSRAMMTDSNNLQRALSGKLVRYNSADSVLSSADAHPNVALRKHVRSSSADRSSLKGVNRRSYQIATTTPQPSKPAENNVLLRPSSHKRQPSIRRLKNFFAESTQPMIEGQVEEGRRASRGRLLGPVPTLSLQDYDDSVVREGFLHFKVATIEKGKRTSAQKSWKLIWVVLKEQKLYLCKDWTRNKLDVSPGGQNSNSTSGSGQPPSELPLEEEEPLNIQGSLISIAYNYVKRKNVFKVITGNGSEYLFQAEDGEDMLAWITSIQVSGNHDNKDGKVTVNKDLILKKTNQIESGAVSFPEKKSKKNQSDPCLLGSTKSLDSDESLPPLKKSSIPRSVSDSATHKIAIRDLSSSAPRVGPVPFYSSKASTLPKTLHFKSVRKVNVKRSNSEDLLKVRRTVISSDIISAPQPLDLSGIPNGLTDINSSNVVVSPIARRPKSEGSPGKEEETQKRNRRKGFIWSETNTSKQRLKISDPVLVSSPLELTDTEGGGIRCRTTEEQQKLLRDLANEQNIKNLRPVSQRGGLKRKKTKKQKSRSIESLKDPDAKSRGKMADKIQRTIRALYDGKRKSSIEKLDEEGSSCDELEEVKERSLLVPRQDSPKPDKRNMRKSRSPKPVRRMTVPIKDIDGSRRFKWRGSVNRIVRKFGQGQTLMQGGTFDVHLEDCPPSVNNELVPFVVELCCRIVEEKGLSFTGIYRVPGNSGTLSALQEELNIRGADAVDPENDERFCELNVVSSLLKSFFRKLPDPLFTNELYDDFISMNRKKDPEERLNGLRRLIHMLPAPHFETLKFLVNHLKAVANNSEVNKMEVRNLAIVFGPTLVRSSACDNMATMVTDMSDQCRIVESVLQHADWFFAEDESHDSDVQALPVPCDDNHEPVPNIDHLLANVGRTPGDISDSTSESSKSKASCVSEKESFSRDVMERIFGAGKRWKQNLAQPDSKPNEEESSDDEFGFKEAKRNQAKAATEPTKTAPQTTPSAPSKYRVAKPAASGIRAGWPNKGHHHASDIPARLYDFYVDNLERMPKNETSQSLPMSSSSTESSPKVTRNSQLRSSLRQTQTGYPLKSHQASNVRLPSNADPGTTHNFRQKDGLTSSPHQPQSYSKASPHDVQRSQRALSSIPVLATSTPMHSGQHSDKVKQSKTGYNPSELSSIEKTMDRSEESDSDSSVYVGDTLEEKLKNLTNLDKKLERRPSRRLANRNHGIFLKITPSSVEGKTATNKKLTTAPSLQAGERITSDNLHMYSKKTTKELYEERKAQRQQHREIFKANRDNRKDNNADRFASGDNAFDRSDPKRQLLRSGSRDDVSVSRRPRQSKEKVKRRHTLGGNDFPAQELWDQPHHASLQNVNQDVPGSAMARLRPQVGASVSSISSKFVPPTRFLEYRSSFRREKSRRTESYL